MLPAVAYTSDEVLAWELRHLYAGSWTCLGRLEELLPDGVTQRAARVGDVGVLLVAGEPVRMFANTCRHRGHELLAAEGDHVRAAAASSAPTTPGPTTWPARSGARPGSGTSGLRARRPRAGRAAGPRLGRLGVRARGRRRGRRCRSRSTSATWRASSRPTPPSGCVLADRHTYEVAANWKVIAENYHECYHCPLIHPELCEVTPPTSGDNYDLPGAWVGGSMVLRDGMATMSLTGESGGCRSRASTRRRVEYVHLLPNLLVSAHPDYVMTHRLVPLAPGRTWVECSWYLAPRGDGTVPDATYAVEFWDLTNRQDWAACESVQRGLGSPHFRPGPFAPDEDAVARLVRLVTVALRGHSPNGRRERTATSAPAGPTGHLGDDEGGHGQRTGRGAARRAAGRRDPPGHRADGGRAAMAPGDLEQERHRRRARRPAGPRRFPRQRLGYGPACRRHSGPRRPRLASLTADRGGPPMGAAGPDHRPA